MGFRASTPTEFSVFFDLLNLPLPTSLLIPVSRIIARSHPDTLTLFETLSKSPLSPCALFCVLTSVRGHRDFQPDYFPLFLEALCCPQIALEQRESYARFLMSLPGADGEYDPLPLTCFLDALPPFYDVPRLLTILLSQQGVRADRAIARRLALFIPDLQALYSAADPAPFKHEDDALASALEAVLRFAQLAFGEPWEDSELAPIFDACWHLLNGPQKFLECADDFFAAYVDADVDQCEEDGAESGDDHIEFQNSICYIMANFPAMHARVVDRVARMERLDLPALRLLDYLNQPVDEAVLARLSPEHHPVWQFYALALLERNGVPIPDDVFHALFDAPGWTGAMIGVALLSTTAEPRLPGCEVLAKAAAHGLDVVRHFQTEHVLQYVELLARLLAQWLRSGAVRALLAHVFPVLMDIAWQFLEELSPRLFLPIARLMCRFLRYQEFAEDAVVARFVAMLQINARRAFDFASNFALVAPQCLARIGGAVDVLEEELKRRVADRVLSVEVCEIALYFVVNGYGGLEAFCAEQLLRDVPLRVAPHFTSLLIAVLQGSPGRVVLERLLECAKSGQAIACQMFLVVVASLCLGEKELSQECVMEAVQLLYERHTFADRSLMVDRLFLAFLCRIVAKTPHEDRTEIWQEIYQTIMKVLQRFIASEAEPSSRNKGYPMKHHALICRGFLWVFGEWNAYVQVALQGLELPPEITGQLVGDA